MISPPRFSLANNNSGHSKPLPELSELLSPEVVERLENTILHSRQLLQWYESYRLQVAALLLTTGELGADDPGLRELEQVQAQLKKDLGFLEELARHLRSQMGLPRRAVALSHVVDDSESAASWQARKEWDRVALKAHLVQIRAIQAELGECIDGVKQAMFEAHLRAGPSFFAGILHFS